MIGEFSRQWAPSASDDPLLSCVIMDVDHFKRINDLYGHIAGDEVLQTIAGVLRDTTRPGDSVARYGGEEFCVILVGASEENALAWAELARERLANVRFELAGQVVRVTASFGVAQRTADMQTIEQLIDAADKALLIAKSSGRNRVTATSHLIIADQLASTASFNSLPAT